MKKVLALTMSLVLVIGMAVSGTIAYLTSTDEDINVMTLGNVEIEQIEQEWNSGKTELVNFTQGKPLYPYVGTLGWENNTVDGGAYRRFTMNNVVDKYVSVKNTGSSEAYIRTVFAFEMGEYSSIDDWKYKVVGYSYNDKSGKEFTGLDWVWDDEFVAQINGKNYAIREAVHVAPVAPKSTTIPSLLQIYMNKDCDNAEVEKLDGNGNGTYDVMVLSQAVQTNGFADAQTALDTAFGEVTPDKALEWFGKIKAVLVGTADELVEGLTGDGVNDAKSIIFTNDITIDPANMSNAYGKTGINVKFGQNIYGNGKTLDIKGAGGTWDSGINTTGGEINNLTITGSFRGVFINHNSTYSERVVLKNVTIEDTTYTISCDQGMKQGLTAYDSTFKGWTSYAATLGDAVFNDCYFGAGNGYSFCRPYAPTEFVGCEFEAGFEMDPRAQVTFENCVIGGVPLTAENLATLVTFNIANATVK